MYMYKCIYTCTCVDAYLFPQQQKQKSMKAAKLRVKPTVLYLVSNITHN